jgi:PPOX class probable F420-dependent enzyme
VGSTAIHGLFQPIHNGWMPHYGSWGGDRFCPFDLASVTSTDPVASPVSPVLLTIAGGKQRTVAQVNIALQFLFTCHFRPETTSATTAGQAVCERNGPMATFVAKKAEVAQRHAIEQPNLGDSLDALENAHYIRLTTFRGSGVPVATPVWFARVGQALYVITDDDTGKVKRIRNNPAVGVAPSTAMGKPTGPTVDGVVHMLSVEEASRGVRALTQKYGWLFLLAGWWHRVQRKTPVVLEIVAPAT